MELKPPPEVWLRGILLVIGFCAMVLSLLAEIYFVEFFICTVFTNWLDKLCGKKLKNYGKIIEEVDSDINWNPNKFLNSNRTIKVRKERYSRNEFELNSLNEP